MKLAVEPSSRRTMECAQEHRWVGTKTITVREQRWRRKFGGLEGFSFLRQLRDLPSLLLMLVSTRANFLECLYSRNIHLNS